jgi:hypothetical protein
MMRRGGGGGGAGGSVLIGTRVMSHDDVLHASNVTTMAITYFLSSISVLQ